MRDWKMQRGFAALAAENKRRRARAETDNCFFTAYKFDFRPFFSVHKNLSFRGASLLQFLCRPKDIFENYRKTSEKS
mgnify:CR=1 FL=1